MAETIDKIKRRPPRNVHDVSASGFCKRMETGENILNNWLLFFCWKLCVLNILERYGTFQISVLYSDYEVLHKNPLNVFLHQTSNLASNPIQSIHPIALLHKTASVLGTSSPQTTQNFLEARNRVRKARMGAKIKFWKRGLHLAPQTNSDGATTKYNLRFWLVVPTGGP